MRKRRREQQLNAKRVVVEEESHEEAEEIHSDQVARAAQSLVEKHEDRGLALTLLRKAFGQEKMLIDTFLQTENAMQALVGLLTGNDPDLCIAAAGCLTNMAAGTDDHARAVFSAAGAYLVTYLQSSSAALQDKCAWGLGNLAGDCAELRDGVVQLGALKPLVALLKSPMPNVVKSATFAICNLLRHEHAHIQEILDHGIIHELRPHMNVTAENRDVLVEVAWVFTYIAAKAEHEHDIVQGQVVPKLGEIVVQTTQQNMDDVQLLTPALRSLGNLCSGSGEARMILLDQCPQLLPSLKKLLTSEHAHIVKESLWVLSNVTVDQTVCEDLDKLEMLPLIVQKLGALPAIQTETLYILCNIASQKDELTQKCVDAGAIPFIVTILKSNELEPLPVALSFIEICFSHTDNSVKLFEEAGGMEGLELLEYHQNETIRSLTNHVLDRYIYKEEVYLLILAIDVMHNI